MPGVGSQDASHDGVGGEFAQALALFSEVFVEPVAYQFTKMSGVEQLALLDVHRTEKDLGEPLPQQRGRWLGGI